MRPIVIERDLETYCYFLANELAHFHRFCDGGFKTKWCGFWVYDQKFFDYFALKINGEWLPPPVRVTYDGDKSIFEYKSRDLTVKETTYLKDQSLIVDIEANKQVQIEVELAVNIKDVSEDYHQRSYQIKEGKELDVSSEAGTLVFEARNFVFHREPYYKEHHHEEEKKQRVFIPGKIFIDGDKVRLKFSGYLRRKIHTKTHKSSSKTNILKAGFADDFEWCCKDLDLVWKSFENSGGLVAGYPYFLQFWGRDDLWSLPALVDIGDFEKALSVLKLFLYKSKEGIIDQMIDLKGQTHFKALDTNALWILALDHYLKYSDDNSFLKSDKSRIKEVLEVIKKEIEEPTKGLTWMDTMDRPGAVEISALNIKALEVAKKLGLATANIKKLKDEFESKYWNSNKNYYKDNLRDDAVTCNPLVPVMLGIAERKQEVLDKIRSEFVNGGVRTRSRFESGYDPNGYHTGMVWGLTTGWAACCEFAYGDPNFGWDYLKFLFSDLRKGCLGAINEAWDGDSLLPNPGLFQTWSSALVIRAIDEFMLGFNVKDGKLVSNPRMPDEVREVTRKKRFGKRWLSVDIKKEKEYIVEVG